MFREMRNDHGRNKAGGRSNKVDDPVKGTCEVGRQILWILKIGQRCGSIESQRHGYDGDVNKWIITDKAERCEEKSGNDVGCLNKVLFFGSFMVSKNEEHK